MIQKILATAATVITILIASVGCASAHVSVKPAEVGVASFQTFTTGVPNEKEDNPTISLRLVIPQALKYVSPNVKPGWTINVAKEGTGEDAVVKEITWSGGSIPSGQRDDFVFSAKAPAKETTLQWKAYQTYLDGTVVAWDQTPNDKDEEGSTPYSQTKVVNDLTSDTASTSSSANKDEDKKTTTALTLSIVALALAAVSFAFKRK